MVDNSSIVSGGSSIVLETALTTIYVNDRIPLPLRVEQKGVLDSYWLQTPSDPSGAPFQYRVFRVH